jgi:D-alanine-D-alanine ligase
MTPLRVGLTFNLKRIDPTRDDAEAEYDSPRTIAALHQAIASFGHEVVRLEATPELARKLPRAAVDVVFNLAEGRGGRCREALVPALCELLRIPYSGSDAAALCATLDKAMGKRILRDAGIPTPDFFLARTGREPLPRGWRFPAIVKPNIEGTSKGITAKSVVDDEPELRRRCRELIRRYRQPAIVEEYVAGREFTVGVLGWPKPRALPPMEVVFLQKQARTVYEYSLKQNWDGKLEYVCPARIPRKAAARMRALALEAFRVLECRDVSRVDFRTDRRGRPYVIELNPLPGMTPVLSDLVMIAEGAGIGYRELIGRVLEGAIRRRKLGLV